MFLFDSGFSMSQKERYPRKNKRERNWFICTHTRLAKTHTELFTMIGATRLLGFLTKPSSSWGIQLPARYPLSMSGFTPVASFGRAKPKGNIFENRILTNALHI